MQLFLSLVRVFATNILILSVSFFSVFLPIMIYRNFFAIEHYPREKLTAPKKSSLN